MSISNQAMLLSLLKFLYWRDRDTVKSVPQCQFWLVFLLACHMLLIIIFKAFIFKETGWSTKYQLDSPGN